MCTMTFNSQLNGIELVFAGKPTEEIREQLKALGFRWHRQKKLWYAKKTAERMALAEKLSSGNIATETASAPAEIVSKYGIKVGDILEDSWGHEQTNVEFYMVTKIISACKIEIVKLGHIQSNHESHGMACDVMPDKDRPIGDPIQKVVSQSSLEKRDSGWHVKISECISLTAWNGRPCYCSWYY